MDKVTTKKRREIMSKIRSKNTKLEIKFGREIWKKGLRYRKHYKIPGKPDFVFVSKKIAIFVDSCFWHKCPKHYREPASNRDYWIPKINRNVERDRETAEKLKKEGWTVLRFWEHEINEKMDLCTKKVIKAYNSKNQINA